ncbi:hypothetical protein TNCV_2652551 [Trichonephila clavipes]|nr:hypothetical protein TNCV_2652551 [Trichonephila clavipes]
MSYSGFEPRPCSTAVRFINHYTRWATDNAIWTPIWRENTLEVGRGLPHLLATSREDLRFNGYLEQPMPQRPYSFVNIHAFSGIRTQAQRLINQHR